MSGKIGPVTDLGTEPHNVRSSKAPLADRVTDQLRSAIINRDLAPGERLAAEAIAERFAVSPTPVREAFARLAGEGFVVALPQRGVRVSEISAADVRDLPCGLAYRGYAMGPWWFHACVRGSWLLETGGSIGSCCDPSPSIHRDAMCDSEHVETLLWCSSLCKGAASDALSAIKSEA